MLLRLKPKRLGLTKEIIMSKYLVKNSLDEFVVSLLGMPPWWTTFDLTGSTGLMLNEGKYIRIAPAFLLG
jgi:hypothetical protein